MAYMMTKETARRWFRRLGPQFKADCLNLEISSKYIAETYGATKNTVARIRQAMAKDYKPRALDYSHPKIYAVLTGDLTQAEAARVLGISQTTVGRYRQMLGVKPCKTEPLRYDDATMALLRSSLDAEHVARALGVEPSTVRKHRELMKPKRRAFTPSDDLEKLTPQILAAKNAFDAARTLGISRSAAQLIRARHKGKKKTLPDPLAHFQDFALHTVAEIAAAVGMSEALVRYYVRTRGIAVKIAKTGITYAQRKARRANRADTAKPRP